LYVHAYPLIHLLEWCHKDPSRDRY